MAMHASSARDHNLVVTAVFPDGPSAEAAFDAVARLGYDKGDINVVMSDDTRARYFSEPRAIDTDLARRTAEGGELGGPKGGRVSLLLPILAAVGTTVALSGIGLIAAGPITAAIAAAGATGVAAGLIGALADWGVPQDRLQQYEAEIHDGAILLAVKPRSSTDARDIAARWAALGGRHVHG
jgi:hypothetical protein